MAPFRRFLLRIYNVFRGGRADRDLSRELDAHLALITDDLERRGMSSADARLSAARAIGGVAQVKERHRDERSFAWIDDAWRDVKFAARVLRKSPGFAAVSVLTLALATGATAAIFSIVNSVVLRPLPFAQPGELVQMYGRLWGALPGDTTPDPMTGPVGTLELEEISRQSRTLRAVVGYSLTTRHLHDGGESERLRALASDTGLFALLGVQPIAGRTFRPDDPLEVAVISERLWSRRFQNDPRLIGAKITLDAAAVTVIGVMPEGFQFPYAAGSMMPGALVESRTDVWTPLPPLRAASGELRRGRVSVVARLAPGVSIDAASAELAVLAARLRVEQPDAGGRTYDVRLVPLSDVVVGSVRRSLWMLFAAVGLVLAAACANVANLLLARMVARTREVVTRAALGASRTRLVRQLLAESLLLSLAGGLLGALVARWTTNLLIVVGASRMPRAHEIALDWLVFAFLLAVCVTVAILFGLAPAIATASVDVHQVAKESSGRSTSTHRFGRLRDTLVVIEVALAFVLALGAGLVVREIYRLENTPTGMDTENVLSLHLTPRATPQDYYDIERRVSALPGVTAAGFIQMVPLQNWGWEADFTIRGRANEGRPKAGLRYVTPGYFKALGIPILRGRQFTEGDTADSPRVILVNDALARRYFPGEDPVGRELDRGTIIGVTGDVRQVRLDRPAEPELYYPAAQNVTMAPDIGISLLVRTSGAPERIAGAVRAAVRGVNGQLAIFNVRTMEQVVSDSLWELNLYRWSIGLFAALALVLAAIGLYGVIAYGVSSRTREFAVRLALGCERRWLVRLVLANGLRLTAAGLVVGALGAMAAAPSLQKLPAQISVEPVSVIAIAVLLLGLALLACLVPALRVVRVDPATALRHE